LRAALHLPASPSFTRPKRLNRSITNAIAAAMAPEQSPTRSVQAHAHSAVQPSLQEMRVLSAMLKSPEHFPPITTLRPATQSASLSNALPRHLDLSPSPARHLVMHRSHWPHQAPTTTVCLLLAHGHTPLLRHLLPQSMHQLQL
jgi:hypothetical protein